MLTQRIRTFQDIYDNITPSELPQLTGGPQEPNVTSEYTAEEDEELYYTNEIIDTGITAIALYDYQAAAEDEISFDPDDKITHIEQVMNLAEFFFT